MAVRRPALNTEEVPAARVPSHSPDLVGDDSALPLGPRRSRWGDTVPLLSASLAGWIVRSPQLRPLLPRSAAPCTRRSGGSLPVLSAFLPEGTPHCWAKCPLCVPLRLRLSVWFSGAPALIRPPRRGRGWMADRDPGGSVLPRGLALLLSPHRCAQMCTQHLLCAGHVLTSRGWGGERGTSTPRRDVR